MQERFLTKEMTRQDEGTPFSLEMTTLDVLLRFPLYELFFAVDMKIECWYSHNWPLANKNVRLQTGLKLDSTPLLSTLVQVQSIFPCHQV